jgi:hypothetical protein
MTASRKIYQWDAQKDKLVEVLPEQVYDRRIEFDDGDMFLPSALQAAEARRIAKIWDSPSIDLDDLAKVQFQMDPGEIMEVEKRLRSRILDAFKIPFGLYDYSREDVKDGYWRDSVLSREPRFTNYATVRQERLWTDDRGRIWATGSGPTDSATKELPEPIVPDPATPRKLVLPDDDGLS